MSDIVKIDNTVANKVLEIRGLRVLIDSDVANLYEIETKRINEAVRNNPDKFPDGYLVELTDAEWLPLRSKFSSSIKGGKTYKPKAFTEKGLYMLATILKSPKATKTTIAIIETFTHVREINRAMVEITQNPEDEHKQKTLLQKAGALITRLVLPSEEELEVIETETAHKFSFLATYEFTKKTKRAKKKKE